MTAWADEPLLDAEQFGGYADLLSPAQMAALVEAFSRELAMRPAQMEDLADRRDIASLRIAAHRLKGAAMTIGASRVAALGAALEQAGPDSLPLLMTALRACARETAAAIGDVDRTPPEMTSAS